MANTILNFHFDYLHTSLSDDDDDDDDVVMKMMVLVVMTPKMMVTMMMLILTMKVLASECGIDLAEQQLHLTDEMTSAWLARNIVTS